MTLVPPRRATDVAHALLLCGSLLTAVGCGNSDPCAGAWYPIPPPGMTAIHVYPVEACPGEPDGSAEHPYRSLGKAVAEAPDNAAVLLAHTGKAGYALGTEVLIDRPMMILGSDPMTDCGPPRAELCASDCDAAENGGGEGSYLERAHYIRVTGKDVVLRGLGIRRPIGVGVWVDGGEALLEDVEIDSPASVEAEGGDHGIGLHVGEGGRATVRCSRITNASTIGVFAYQASLDITKSTISQSKKYGVRLELSDAVISRTQVLASEYFGVSVYSSSLHLEASLVQGTPPEDAAAADEFGHGVVAGTLAGEARRSDVTLIGNTIESNKWAGVLLDDALGLISGNVVARNGESNTLAPGGGILIQKTQPGDGGTEPGWTDGVVISGNEIRDNHYLGVSVGSGARAILAGNLVSGTRFGKAFNFFEFADGVQLSGGASARLEGNVLQECARYALFVDDPLIQSADGYHLTSLRKNTIQMCPAGLCDCAGARCVEDAVWLQDGADGLLADLDPASGKGNSVIGSITPCTTDECALSVVGLLPIDD